MRNARFLAQKLMDDGVCKYVVDEIAKLKHDRARPVVKDGYVYAQTLQNEKRAFPAMPVAAESVDESDAPDADNEALVAPRPKIA